MKDEIKKVIDRLFVEYSEEDFFFENKFGEKALTDILAIFDKVVGAETEDNSFYDNNKLYYIAMGKNQAKREIRQRMKGEI